MQRAFMDGYVTETGTGIAKILPPTNPFLPESGEKKQTVIEKLKEYLNKFLNTTEDSYSTNVVAMPHNVVSYEEKEPYYCMTLGITLLPASVISPRASRSWHRLMFSSVQ